MSRPIAINLPPRDISINLDLDALVASVDLHSFDRMIYASCIKLQVQKQRNKKNTIRCKNLNFDKHTGIKIGILETDIGSIDIYFRTTLSPQDCFLRMKHLVTKLSSRTKQFISVTNEKISGSLLQSDYSVFFGGLDEIDPQFNSFFMETFGNKGKTTTAIENIDDITGKLNNLFNAEYHNLIDIDVCFSFDFGNNKVTMPKPELFTALGIKPDYNPFFSEIYNCNKSLIKKDTGERTALGMKYKIDKVNLYSTWKTLFIIPEINSTPITSAMALNCLYNCCITGTDVKLENAIATQRNIDKRFEERATSSFAYRMEFRCNLEDISQVRETIFATINTGMFTYIASSSMIESTTMIVRSFLDNIAPPREESGNNDQYTVDNLFESCIIEQVYINRFIKGRPIGSCVNSELAAMINSSKDVVMIASLVRGYNNHSVTHKKKILDQVLYAGFYKRPEIEKTLMNQLIDYYYDATQNDIHDRIFWSYLFSNNAAFDNLLAETYSDKTPKTVVKILLRVFEKPEGFKKSSLLMIMAKMAAHRFGVHNLVEKLVICCEEKPILSLYNYKGVIIPVTRPVLLTVEATRRESLVARYSKYECAKEFKNGRPDEPELIRFIHAMYKYRLSRNKLIAVANDFSYSLNFRCSMWLKNRMSNINSVAANKDRFLRIMTGVRNWVPESFTAEQRIQYMNSLGLDLSGEQQSTYLELVSLDSINASIANELNKVSFIDIFCRAVTSTRYKALNIDTIRSWGSYDVVLPSLVEAPVIISSPSVFSCSQDLNNEILQNNEQTSQFDDFVYDNIADNNCYFEEDHNNMLDQGEVIEIDDVVVPSSKKVEIPEEQVLLDSSILVRDDKIKLKNSDFKIIEDAELEKTYYKLFKTYGFNEFYEGSSRISLFSSRCRLGISEWSSSIQKLISHKLVYEVGSSANNQYRSYRCSLISDIKKKIVSESLILKLAYNLSQSHGKFTASNLHRRLHSFCRPKVNVLIDYLNALVDRNLLLSETVGLNTYYIKSNKQF